MRILADCKKVHLLHMRKAGGTTARHVLKRICDVYNLPFSASEGWPMSHGAIDDDTFVVINMRSPLERIFSLYNAEGRWRRQSGERATVDFSDWVNGREQCRKKISIPLWNYVSNHYVRSLCDNSQSDKRSADDIRTREISNEDYKKAVVGLMRVDMVMICEWLNDDFHRRYLSARLLGRDDGLISLPHNNQTARKHNYDVRRELNDQDRERILAANLMDLELYRFARWRTKNEVF
jgi:hypothetical protein